MQREDIGSEVYDWIIEHIGHTGRDADRLSVKEVWNAAVEASGEGAAAFGFNQSAFSRTVRKVFALGPARKARFFGAAPENAWFGIKWINGGDQPSEEKMV